MSITTLMQKRFDTVLAAAKNGDLALMECRDAKEPSKVCNVMCIAYRNKDGGATFIPVALLHDEFDPRKLYIAPEGHDSVEHDPATRDPELRH